MRRPLFLLVCVALLAAGNALGAPAEAPPSDEKIRALTELLRDPAIQTWLKSEAERTHLAADRPLMAGDAMSHQMMAARLDTIRSFARELVAAVPALPDELKRAGSTFTREFRERGTFGPFVLLAAFAALGFAFEWLFRWMTAGFRRRILNARADTLRDRLHVLSMRAASGLGQLLTYALASIGAFLLFDWPPLLKQVVVAYLLVFLIIRLVHAVGEIMLSPDDERFRVVPMTSASARFWHRWSTTLVGYYFFVTVTLELLTMLGVSHAGVYVIGLAGGIALLSLALFVLWRHPASNEASVRSRHRLGSWLLTLYLVTTWFLLFTGSAKPFYIAIILLLLPLAIHVNRRAIHHLLRPASDEAGADAMPSLAGAATERALRAALLIAGALLIIHIVELDLGALTQGDTMVTRIVQGVLNAAVIVLIADFAWVVIRVIIDRKLAGAQSTGAADSEEERRRARLRTLLPISRNILFIVLLAMALLMALSALGIEIGPLIAGAGVVGVAVGFGAQTIVRDIMSGVFYLLDDAFRVGEYIQSGNYKGTVESFSLRSVKLRHHRGPLYTVPFGTLGAIQNMSRDWVIDKLAVGVTYDTDLDKVKKIVKQIGQELINDPELAPHILETLKMQGVEQFGDFAIQVRMKLMTKPGEQFVVRRRALALIKKAFDANGVKFAYPTVQVAGGEPVAGAVAQHGLELVKPQPRNSPVPVRQ
jgi:moderate conductance mechanosensitive channel